jgi:REP element-mobilizing transposase RayT
MLPKKYINRKETLMCGETYHVYNKAVGNKLLFRKIDDYEYFLEKLSRFIHKVANIYAYCLIPNHFHLLIKIKESNEIPALANIDEDDYSKYLMRILSNFFNSYSKSYNKIHQRQGRLFTQPFKRIIVEDENYFLVLINYIHRNPLHHGLVKQFSEWNYSSYQAFLTYKTTGIDRDEVLSYFDSLVDFVEYHEENKTKPGMDELYLE